MKIFGLDLGSKTLGVSVSDALGLIATNVTTIRFEEDDYDDALAKLIELNKQYKVKKVVLGLPKHMNGDIGIRGEISIQFKTKLEKVGFEVVLWDERLSSVAANRLLASLDTSSKKRKKVVDQVAASNILQGYLDSKR